MATFSKDGASTEQMVASELDVSAVAMLDALQAKTETLKLIVETMKDPAKIGPDDLLEMQRQMNLLSQLAEVSVSVVSALHQQVQSATRRGGGG